MIDRAAKSGAVGSWRPKPVPSMRHPGLSRRDQNAATPGIQTGEHVADQITDHPGICQHEIELVRRLEQHAGPGFAFRVLNDRSILAGGSVRAIVNGVQGSALLGQLPVHLDVDLVQPGLGDHAPTDRRLIGHEHADEAGTASRVSAAAARQELDMGGVGEVVNVFDQGAVAVKEDRRARSRRVGIDVREDVNGVFPGPLEGPVSAISR